MFSKVSFVVVVFKSTYLNLSALLDQYQSNPSLFSGFFFVCFFNNQICAKFSHQVWSVVTLLSFCFTITPLCTTMLTLIHLSVLSGQVISALRETRLLNNTVVIFTADHGELAMEHRQFYKMSMYEGSSHVPLMIMGPGLMSGLQVNQLVSMVDLYPTVLGKKRIKHIRFNPL